MNAKSQTVRYSTAFATAVALALKVIYWLDWRCEMFGIWTSCKDKLATCFRNIHESNWAVVK